MSRILAVLSAVFVLVVGVTALAQPAAVAINPSELQVFVDMGKTLLGEVGPAWAVSILAAVAVTLGIVARYVTQILKMEFTQRVCRYRWDNFPLWKKLLVAVAVAFGCSFFGSFGTALIAGAVLKVAALAALKLGGAAAAVALFGAMGTQGAVKALKEPAQLLAGASKP